MSKKDVSKNEDCKNSIQSVSHNISIISGEEKKPRLNWEEAFIEMHKMGDDRLLIDSVLIPDEW